MVPEAIHTTVQGLGPAPFWFLLTALAVAAPFLLYKGTQAFWRLRTITDTPTARIQSAPQGYVELAGQAAPHLTQVEGPLTGRPCLWYRYRVEEEQGSGSRRSWRAVDSGESSAPFLLDDGSGQCIVDPVGAYVRPRRVERWSGRYRNPRVGEPGKWYESHRYRYVEERIDNGAPLYCLGRFETPLRGPAERDQLRRALLKVWKQDPARLARFDRDGDGSISLEEWEQARAQADLLAERAEAQRSLVPVLARLAATGDERQPFLISAFAEEELATTLRWHAFWLTGAFVVVAVAAVVTGLARFGG